MLSVCLRTPPPPPSAFESLNQSITLDVYIMAPEPISSARLRNPSHQYVCLYVNPSSFLGSGLV
jgi:hypothetical protein